MPIKAILLDLDGTILNTLEDLTDSVNHALSACGFQIRSISEIRKIVGNGVVDLITRSLPEGAPEEAFSACLAEFKKHYEKNKTNKTRPYDGIMKMLSALKDSGYKLAIVSNKHDDAVCGLHKLFFADYIDFAIGNVGFLPKKPSPEIVHYAIKKLGAEISESVYVGDSEVDIKTAANSGIPCVSVTWGFRDENILRAEGANIIIHSPGELKEIVDKMQTNFNTKKQR